MAQYCVNRQAQVTGEHEVHNLETCGHLPVPANRQALGQHPHCQSAVQAARQYFSNVDGCQHCSPACHRR